MPKPKTVKFLKDNKKLFEEVKFKKIEVQDDEERISHVVNRDTLAKLNLDDPI